MFYRDWLEDKIVVGADWPLSLGWKIAFYSSNEHFVGKKFFVPTKLINGAVKHKKDIKGVEGMAMAWNHKRIRAIAIFYKGKSSVRFIELISHEVSHVIDHIIEDAAIKVVDTELRAYLMDWIVGKILARTNINNLTKTGYDLPIYVERKIKKNKKPDNSKSGNKEKPKNKGKGKK